MRSSIKVLFPVVVFLLCLPVISATWVTLNDFNDSGEIQNYALYGNHASTTWGAGYYHIEPGTDAGSWLGRQYSAIQGAHNLTRTDYDEFRIQYMLMGVGGNDAYTWCLGAGYAESKDGYNMPSDALCQESGSGATSGYIRELHQGVNNGSAMATMAASTKYWFIVKGPNGNGTYNYSWTADSGSDTPGAVIKTNISRYEYTNTTWNIRITAYANSGNAGARLLQFQANAPITSKISFINQTPADITSTNLFNNSVNISYLISVGGMNTSFPLINYQLVNGSIFVNGSEITLNGTKVFYSNVSQNYTFLLDDNEVLPGTYNINQSIMEGVNHSSYDLTGQNDYARIEILNVNYSKSFNIFEVMLNTSGAGVSNIYYCNSSYSSGKISSSSSCVLFGTYSGAGYNHTHKGGPSKHNIFSVPISFNLTEGKIGKVTVTPTSYFMVGGIGAGGDAFLWYIPNTSRPTAWFSTGNGGTTWTNRSSTGTPDAHLHQFSPTTNITYRVCAENSTYSECSGWRSDNLDITNLPPNPPTILSPVENQAVGQFNNISWVASTTSFTNVTVTGYNISLLNPDGSFNRTIYGNVSNTTTSYYWDTAASNLTVKQYMIKILVTDSNNLTAYSISELFNQTYGWQPHDVVACPTLDHPGTYTLLNSLHTTNNICVEFAANNAVLDCDGYSVEAASAVIHLTTGVSGATVRNCQINGALQGVDNGLVAANIADLTIDNNVFSGQSDRAIRLGRADNVTVANNILNGTRGLQISGNRAFIYDNIFTVLPDLALMLYDVDGTIDLLHDIHIFNNYFLDTAPGSGISYSDDDRNSTIYFNTTQQAGTPIYAGLLEIGGNYWARTGGDGFSETCADANYDAFCDAPYEPINNFFDYLPLTTYVAPNVEFDCKYYDRPTLTIPEQFICELHNAFNMSASCYGLTLDAVNGSLIDSLPRQESLENVGPVGAMYAAPINASNQSVVITFSTKRLKAETPTIFEARCYMSNGGGVVTFSRELQPATANFNEPSEFLKSAGENSYSLAIILIVVFVVVVGFALFWRLVRT